MSENKDAASVPLPVLSPTGVAGENTEGDLYDAVIIGGGPAGLSAAIYMTRAGYRTLVVEAGSYGGQITLTSEVRNYPGIERATGQWLAESMHRQAAGFGAEFLEAKVQMIDPRGDVKVVATSKGVVRAFSVLIATGAVPRRAGFAGEREFADRSVAYCATSAGNIYNGYEVFVIGGGYSAAEEAVYLTQFADHVTVLVRGHGFTCAAQVAEKCMHHPKIDVRFNTVLEAVGSSPDGESADDGSVGDGCLRWARLRDRTTGETTEYRARRGMTFGVFVFAGFIPNTTLVRDFVDLDERGYIRVDAKQRTNVPGVYAAGDVCAKDLRQVVTAVADGAVAALDMQYLASDMQGKTGQIPPAPVPRY